MNKIPVGLLFIDSKSGGSFWKDSANRKTNKSSPPGMAPQDIAILFGGCEMAVKFVL